MENNYTLKDFETIIARLRGADGCPWDRVQTHDSLKTCLLEESYEVVEAINNKDDENLAEELGDVLLQIVMHARIAEEEGRFTMKDIINRISEKMIRRHPHVFGDKKADNVGEVLKNWEEIKKEEKGSTTSMDEITRVPKALPANIRAQKVQSKAAKMGFEFEQIGQVWDKVYEELDELKNSINLEDKSQISEEFGDVMFSMINLSRFLGLNAENSLTNATEKFINRLGSIDNLAKTRGLVLNNMTLEQLDILWQEVKNHI